jgi:hypothetical protein
MNMVRATQASFGNGSEGLYHDQNAYYKQEQEKN